MKKINGGNRLKYLPLIKAIAITDFKLKYQGSVLGYFWSLAKPLAYFTVLYVIFTKIFDVGSSVPNYPVYLLLGVLVFTFFGDATNSGMRSVVDRGDLLRKVHFPPVVLLISSTLTAFMTFCFNALAIFVFAYLSDLHLGATIFQLPLYLIELYAFVLGVSFYLATLYVRYRDIGQIWELTTQILFYATPILYTISQVPEKYARFMLLSPLAQIILDIRYSVIGAGIVRSADYWRFEFMPHILVIIIFFSGYYVFNKNAAKFAEVV
jgi:ABC-2 type transport system permease protein